MLYTLVGNGEANRKEVLATIESLASTVRPDDEFWMILVAEENPSATVTEVLKYLTSKQIYFEVIARKDTDVGYATSAAQEIHYSSNPNLYRSAVNISERRAVPGEKSEILVMDDNLEENDLLMEALSIATDRGIPAYELGGQMVQIVFDDMPTEAAPVPEEVTEEEPSYFVGFSRADLEELTLNELKVLVSSLDLVPRDMRSKESIIDAILEDSLEDTEPVEESPKTDNRKFYLLTVEEDGSVSISPHVPT